MRETGRNNSKQGEAITMAKPMCQPVTVAVHLVGVALRMFAHQKEGKHM